MTDLHLTNLKEIPKSLFLPPTEYITAARLEQSKRSERSPWGDAYAVALFKEENGNIPQIIKSGYFPAGGNDGKLTLSPQEKAWKNKVITHLQNNLIAQYADASFNIHDSSDKWEHFPDERSFTLYIKSRDGIIGVSWRQQFGNKIDAKNMCFFLLYLIGGINEENDSVFYEASQNLLDGELKKYTSQIVQRIKRRKVYDTIDIGKESTCA